MKSKLFASLLAATVIATTGLLLLQTALTNISAMLPVN